VHIHDLLKDDYPYQELFPLLRKVGYGRYIKCDVGADTVDPKKYLRAYRIAGWN
jgi:hypothetical protein